MLVEASMNLDDFMEAMGIMNSDDLQEEDFTTLRGLAMFLIGRVPKAGDLFSYKNPVSYTHLRGGPLERVCRTDPDRPLD